MNMASNIPCLSSRHIRCKQIEQVIWDTLFCENNILTVKAELIDLITDAFYVP